MPRIEGFQEIHKAQAEGNYLAGIEHVGPSKQSRNEHMVIVLQKMHGLGKPFTTERDGCFQLQVVDLLLQKSRAKDPSQLRHRFEMVLPDTPEGRVLRAVFDAVAGRAVDAAAQHLLQQVLGV
jgi:hypothetical protein